jgi:hypothetical protein
MELTWASTLREHSKQSTGGGIGEKMMMHSAAFEKRDWMQAVFIRSNQSGSTYCFPERDIAQIRTKIVSDIMVLRNIRPYF